MELLGKPRHRREGRRLRERDVSESNPEAKPKDNSTGSFDFAALRSGSQRNREKFVIAFASRHCYESAVLRLAFNCKAPRDAKVTAT